jgi:hypothetical protein
MAIKVGGTTVIDDSQNLTSSVGGLKTVGGYAILGSGDIAVGAGAPDWDPTSTPDVTLTSSGTWTKPGSLGSDDWVVFYMIGGGGGAGSATSTWKNGGCGGHAAIFGARSGTLPSSISFTVGAGGASVANSAGSAGGDTYATINSRTYTALGGPGGHGTINETIQTLTGFYTLPFGGQSPLDYDQNSASSPTKTGFYTDAPDSIFAGGHGGTYYTTGSGPGTSQFAGNGGGSGQAGIAPGGGCGGNSLGGGARGEVRIYYV